MDEIINIHDAKAFKRMGMPLNTPVETRYFSEAYSRQWFGLDKVRDAFMFALYDYDGETVKWKRIKKRFDGLIKAVNRCNACIGKLEDPNEQMILHAILEQRAVPFLQYWEDALDAIDNGATLTITPADWPRWTEED